MKFSVNWLRDFVELPASVDDLAHLLTMAGVEIEGIETRGADFDNVVVAQIKESSQHPNADRLSVCVVDDGNNHARQIVCGAKNYKIGDKVPLALPGAELPGGLKIRESKLRDVESQGMLCSAKELQLAEDSEGLLILSPDARIGAPIGEIFPADTILDVEITPNRGDLLSHFGLAREIAALTGKPILKTTDTLSAKTQTSGVTLSATRECPFISFRRIENIKVGPSPAWLRNKIESVGVRSINNVVDASNFVMLEYGQPTHAFDAAKLDGDIEVRLARDGEKLLALDGRTYQLAPHHLVIADSKRPVGLAGVMGGEESGVSASTTTVLVEAAYFLPSSIRRTARELNLPSDASYRFERGVDPEMILRASQRVASIIEEVAEGKSADTITVAGELPAAPADIALRYERVDQVIGAPIPPARADAILTNFGLKKKGAWKIPSHRRDLQREIDLIEEIVRAHGIDKIPSEDRSRFTPLSDADRNYDFETRLRRDLVSLGFFEAKTSNLIPTRFKDLQDGMLNVRNPLVEDNVYLRPSLLAGLVRVLEVNLSQQIRGIRLFEIGKVFRNNSEQLAIALLIAGNTETSSSWRGSDRPYEIFDLKGFLAAICENTVWKRSSHNGFSVYADIIQNGQHVGSGGQLTNAIVRSTGAKGSIFFAQLLVENIHNALRSPSFRELDRFPSVTRDIALFVAPEITHAEVERVIASVNEPLLERVGLFDLFEEKAGDGTKSARKSLAYSLTYRDKNRTLTSDEVSAAHARIRERLQAEIRAELRE
ncbi:MAG: phenylalanine--tRNA ligase subunit beta [Verrucomicrobiota bacterium]|nr:phenylalanine--tRNA ligase subunit beta [Verrucomicrobiota bacterium]